MKQSLAVVAAVAGAFLALIALVWVIQGSDFFLYKVFAPKYEAARRETFEQSKAYNDGMAQELRAMQMEYIKATPDQQTALASVILHRVDGYPEDQLPEDLRTFVNDLKRARGLAQ